MTKEKTMRKDYAITTSLVIFFSIITLIGTIRLIVLSKTETIDLESMSLENIDTAIDLSSYNLRIINTIESTYGIDVYYGDRINVESVNGVSITDDYEIFGMLTEIVQALSKYPKDLIKEIEEKDYSVDIYLVDYFTSGVEALANRNSIGQFKIYISNTENLKRAFHHEYYHILDYYIRLETDETTAYINWDKYNPDGFKYTENVNNITGEYVYVGTAGAHFVTPYAKYSEKEDRAETFAEMLTASKEEIFFNEGEHIKGKIDVLKNVLLSTFESVREEINLSWN